MKYKIVLGNDIFNAVKTIRLNANKWYMTTTDTHIIFERVDDKKQLVFNRKFVIYCELED